MLAVFFTPATAFLEDADAKPCADDSGFSADFGLEDASDLEVDSDLEEDLDDDEPRSTFMAILEKGWM
ncbi:MAG: hypothetical protein JXB05_03795 [Myxococcaceae bacterium]|nr:hypothetical protein [Myxococcaceae bacterium]